MPSADATSALDAEARQTLLDVARRSIEYGVKRHLPMAVGAADYAPSLQVPRASFVTLHRHGRLRGCIGHLQAQAPLVEDVADNAFAAAFRDPRFPPLSAEELADLEIHISVLSAPQPLSFSREQELRDQLRPGVDGLILEEGRARGTFLPSVWSSLPDPAAFLTQLKIKAGLAPDYWSDTLRVSRYETESFP